MTRSAYGTVLVDGHEPDGWSMQEPPRPSSFAGRVGALRSRLHEPSRFLRPTRAP